MAMREDDSDSEAPEEFTVEQVLSLSLSDSILIDMKLLFRTWTLRSKDDTNDLQGIQINEEITKVQKENKARYCFPLTQTINLVSVWLVSMIGNCLFLSDVKKMGDSYNLCICVREEKAFLWLRRNSHLCRIFWCLYMYTQDLRIICFFQCGI